MIGTTMNVGSNHAVTMGVDEVVVTMGAVVAVVVVVAMGVAESTTKATIITVRTMATKGV